MYFNTSYNVDHCVNIVREHVWSSTECDSRETTDYDELFTLALESAMDCVYVNSLPLTLEHIRTIARDTARHFSE